ncbi:MAG: AI-2E family transporter, partial [Bacteroidales bacterium]|nr:AI-2E family transporter [Bacteroidales bacterium]
RTIGEKLLGAFAGTTLGILQFALSTIIAGVFLTYSEDASRSGKSLFTKLMGERGESFARIAEQTIRNVATGVIGVALIQSTLIGLGLFIIDIPLAGVWIILILIFAIAQLPVLLIIIPIIIWLFAFKEPLPAVLWTIYLLAAGLLDNILKPILMGKGAAVPMLVIFLGAIGGFIAFGFLGLFLGAIGLSLGYKLYQAWLIE